MLIFHFWSSDAPARVVNTCLCSHSVTVLGLLDPGDEGTVIIWNTGTTYPVPHCHILWGLNLQHHCCENPRSHICISVFFVLFCRCRCHLVNTWYHLMHCITPTMNLVTFTIYQCQLIHQHTSKDRQNRLLLKVTLDWQVLRGAFKL